jgi:predicted transcriptional regulator
MNAKLKDILERAQSWPEPWQEYAADVLQALEQELSDPYELTEEDKAAIERGLEDARQGRFASDAQVKELFDRYRPR